MLLTIVVLGTLGVLNYRRNEPLDAELQNRPYKGLSDADVELLIEAYRTQKGQIERKLERVAGREDPMDRYAPADLAGKLQGFDRAQKNASRWREVHGEVLEQEVELERLAHEQSIRARGLDDERVRIWRRVSTF